MKSHWFKIIFIIFTSIIFAACDDATNKHNCISKSSIVTNDKSNDNSHLSDSVRRVMYGSSNTNNSDISYKFDEIKDIYLALSTKKGSQVAEMIENIAEDRGLTGNQLFMIGVKSKEGAVYLASELKKNEEVKKSLDMAKLYREKYMRKICD